MIDMTFIVQVLVQLGEIFHKLSETHDNGNETAGEQRCEQHGISTRHQQPHHQTRLHMTTPLNRSVVINIITNIFQKHKNRTLHGPLQRVYKPCRCMPKLNAAPPPGMAEMFPQFSDTFFSRHLQQFYQLYLYGAI